MPQDSYTLNLSASSNAGEEPITGWVIFAGERTINVAGNQASVTFALDSGTYDISAAAIGLHGDLYDATGVHSVTVINVAPSLIGDLAEVTTVNEGQTVSLHANAIDPGPNDVLTYTWNVNKNGSPFATGLGSEFVFVPDDEGVYTASVTVTDLHEGSTSGSVEITASNASPTQVDAGADQTAEEGEEVRFFGFAADPGSADARNESAGGLLPVNDNDSDGDGIIDYQDPSVSPTDPELVPLNIDYPHVPAGTQLVLTKVSGGDSTKVYDQAGNEINFIGGSYVINVSGSGRASLLLGGGGAPLQFNAALQTPTGPTAGDTAEEKPLSIRLDVDSKNDSGFDPDQHPAPPTIEDDMEDDPEQLGKLMGVNDGDSDYDDIPDFADGFDRDRSSATTPALDDNITVGKQFVPVVVQIPANFNAQGAKIWFEYNASDPSTDIVPPGVSASGGYEFSGTGTLRLWTKDGGVARDGRDVANGGDFVSAGSGYTTSTGLYTPTDLGIGADGKLTLWIEAVRPGNSIGSERIVAHLEAADGRSSSDAVRVTPLKADLGFNNASNHPGDLRPTTPDVEFAIDAADERYEEHGQGLRWWWSNPSAGYGRAMSLAELEDSSQFPSISRVGFVHPVPAILS